MRTTLLALTVFVWFLTTTPSLTGGADPPREDSVVLGKIKALQDRNNPERLRIVRELRELGPCSKAAIPALMDVVKGEPKLRMEAAATLGEIGAAAVPLLIKTLEDSDKSVQKAAIFGLQWAKADARPAVPTLIKMMKAGDTEMRIATGGALGWIPCPESAQALADLLVSERDYNVRWRTAASLAELGPEAKAAVPALAKVLREMNDLQKGPLPEVLDSGPPGWLHPVQELDGRIRIAFKKVGKPAVPTLTQLLKDPDKDLRQTALQILEDIGPEASTSVPAVMKCLKDREPEVRLQAALTLSDLGPDARLSLPALRKLLRDPSTQVRQAAACAVLRLKPPSDEALAVLLDGTRDRDRDVRLLAISYFKWLGLTEKRVVDALFAAAKGDEDELVRSRALNCLEKLNLPAAVVVPVLDTWIGDRSEEVRVRAVWQLGTVKDSPLAVPSLLRALRDPSAQVRASAAEALGSHEKGAVTALPTLTKVSQDDPDEHVRYKAACALATIEKAHEQGKPKGEDPASDPLSRQKED